MTLFDVPAVGNVRRTDSVQAVNGARRAAVKLPNRRERILEALGWRPMTDDELCVALNEDTRWWPSVKTARSALKKQGKVVATGRERRGQMVWRLASRREDAHETNVIDSL